VNVCSMPMSYNCRGYCCSSGYWIVCSSWSEAKKKEGEREGERRAASVLEK
jgi:hypothetical protein